MPESGAGFNAIECFSPHRDFRLPELTTEVKAALAELCKQARGSVIKMTTVAGSGHPGGSMSSMEFYMLLFSLAKLNPAEPWWDDRDRIIVSHGHTSPGVYSALGHNGFFDVTSAHWAFRLAGSPFEGHVERSVPGVEWDTGNLGQGLSAACGKALALRARGKDCHIWVTMGDGEQQKGQLGEARRLAVKYKLSNVTAIIDFNQLQISGDIRKVMPQNIADDWKADGWNVIEVDGHNLDELYREMRKARHARGANAMPTMILAHTVMGKGYPAIENDHNYHGAPLSMEQAREAFVALGLTEPGYDDLDELKAKRSSGELPCLPSAPRTLPEVSLGEPREYPVDKAVDNRSAWGNALVDIAEANKVGAGGPPVLVFDCDLAVSVKTGGFEKQFPDFFVQCGITEHSTATAAGAASSEGALTYWSDFGVFGVCETYNQNRLNDINHTNLKVMCTHCGLDVGEDGKTHQCIDYFGLSRSVFGWRMFTPADANQTDRIVRYVSAEPGNFLVVMGRSKWLPLADESGAPLFGAGYEFQPGRVDLVRQGSGVSIVCAGNVAPQGLAAWELLSAEGVQPRLISSAHWAEFSEDDLRSIAEFGRIVTVEDHNVNNGFGVSLSAELFSAGMQAQITKLGVREYGPSGKSADVYKMMGLDGESIAGAVRDLLVSSKPAKGAHSVGA